MQSFSNASIDVPFPDDVPTAPLTKISLRKLVANDPDESARLFEACRTSGFFVVDLRDCSSGSTLLQAVDPMFNLAEDVFKLDLAEKDLYSFKPGAPIFGYKGFGVAKVDSKGTPDRCEFWAISKDDMLGSSPRLPNPEVISRARERLAQFILRCHGLCELVSSHLDRHLGLPSGTLARLQNLDERAGNAVRLIKTPPQAKDNLGISLVPHTDIGAITVLFNILGGLQILTPKGPAHEEDEWQYVKPAPGCAIINMGDAMVQWTNGVLRSNMHRVTWAPGAQGELVRYSVAYFSRPTSNVLMKALEGSNLIASLADEDEGDKGDVTAYEWELMKGAALRAGTNKAQSSGGRRLPAAV